ncbi:MAG: leucine-rich repeat domain-containing protein [Alphaproteobacteria bacterium]|nr:leucine-rich repeat domain-containing protein [Alphaproteobacteria bacterium]
MKKILIIMMFASVNTWGMIPSDSNGNSGSNKRSLSCIRGNSEEQSIKKRLRKSLKSVTYVQPYLDDHSILSQWPQEQDDSQDSNYKPSYSVKKNKASNSVSSEHNIFEDVISQNESNDFGYNLRNQPNPVYVQPYMDDHSVLSQWPAEVDDSQDSNYRPSSSVKRNSSTMLPLLKFSKQQELRVRQLESIYRESQLDLINIKENLQRYKEFPHVEKLRVVINDLSLIDSSKFPKLKELSIDSRIVGRKIDKDKKNKKKSIITDYFSKDYTKTLRKFLEENPNLESISIVRCNNIKNLSSVMDDLSNIKSLTLKFLRVTRVPSSIGNLTELRKLDLSNNKIRRLSESMGNLKKLEELTLVGNYSLRTFPKVITQLPNLKLIRIDQSQKNLWKESIQDLKRINKNLKIEIW